MPALDRARQPFQEQIDFFRKKINVPTATWKDVWQSAHDRGFMVAGAAKADLLSDFRKAVDGAIEDGKTIDEFAKDFDTIVEKHGWQYNGSRDWRLRVIYKTNVSTSYNAGRLQQLRDPELQKLKPYWMYKHSDSVIHPRPLHVSWDGVTLPADHPWFQTHYPPNGWGCHCRIVAVSKAEAKRQGGVFKAPDDGIDTTTGAPAGIDEGWAYMPGNSVTQLQQDVITPKLDAMSDIPAQAAFAAMAAEWEASGILARWMDKPEGDWPLVRLPEKDAESIGAQTKVGQLSAETLKKQKKVHPEITVNEYAHAQHVVDIGKHVKDGKSSLVYWLEESGHVLVVKATRTGKGLFVTSFRRLSKDEAKRDREIRRLESKGK
ncbi:MAG: phage head morphogenesis protein [bacterium]